MTKPDRLVVIGASAGGVPALMRLVGELPHDFGPPVLIVLHIGPHKSVLPQLLAGRDGHDVAHARDGERLAPRTVRVAPPDHHMLVHDGTIVLNRGPRENLARPAIDPLFRSAALAKGPGVIGVVLTGRLDDGTVGLQEIKRCGGIAVVQDPQDAEEPSMPLSAIQEVAVDHVVPLALIPMLLVSLADQEVAPPTVPCEGGAATAEMDLSLHRGDPMQALNRIARPSTFVCPECHGALWQILDSRPQRYRCHTGHAFSARALQSAMAGMADQAGWNALRAMQERSLLLHQLADLERSAGHDDEAKRLEVAATHIERQVGVLERVLEDGPDPVE